MPGHTEALFYCESAVFVVRGQGDARATDLQGRARSNKLRGLEEGAHRHRGLLTRATGLPPLQRRVALPPLWSGPSWPWGARTCPFRGGIGGMTHTSRLLGGLLRGTGEDEGGLPIRECRGPLSW